MKILMLPINIASFPIVTCNALNNIEGISSKCMSRVLHKYQESSKDLIHIPAAIQKKYVFKWVKHKLTNRKVLKDLIKEADVLHYYWGPAFPKGEDLHWAASLGKPIFIEWLGSDIRNPELLQKINPYFKDVYNNGYEYRDIESEENSIAVQQLFAKFGSTPLLCPEMSLFLDRRIFPDFKLLFQRISCKDIEPHFPDCNKRRPLIVHSPSATNAKGTKSIVEVLEKLKNSYDFDFKLLHNISRHEVLDIVKQADIIVDQIVVGGYGMAAIEGMSLGKPVMSYIMPAVFEAGLPTDCPIVNTSKDNLEANLVMLIKDAELRNVIGRKSREFTEKYHNSDLIAQQLLGIYRESINRMEFKTL